MEEVAGSTGSPLSGVHYGLLLGIPLTLLAALGALRAVRRIRQPLYAGLLVWLAANIAMLLVNPLPWQRYYLPLIPVAVVLAAVGLWWFAGKVLRRATQSSALRPRSSTESPR